MNRPRVRDLGIIVGKLPTGAQNVITDVAGVRVGQTTLIAGEGTLQPSHGPIRTGVTVILPHDDDVFRHKVHAAVHTHQWVRQAFRVRAGA
jgi:D-aminopeptidase